jgi:hypothetical protein
MSTEKQKKYISMWGLLARTKKHEYEDIFLVENKKKP